MPGSVINAARAERYSAVAIILHWAIATLLIFQVALGLRMEGADGPAKFATFQLHKSIGITLLLLVAIRLLWRIVRRPPPIHARPWEKGLAHIVHALLYLLMFALPISGWIIVSTSRIVVPTLLFGTIPWPHLPVPAGMRDGWNAAGEFLHVNLVWVLIGLFALHVAGALKHHFIDSDGEISRMVPGVKAGARWDPRLLAIGVVVVLAAGLGLRWLPLVGPEVAAPPRVAAADEAAQPPAPTPVPLPTSAPRPTPTPSVSPTPVAEEKADASRWRIAPSSALTFATTWSGQPIEGGFRKFDGTILFGPGDLPNSRVTIAVDVASIYSGDDQRDETLKSADWFSAGSFGTATFSASSFRHLGADRYVADGTLRIKSVSLPSSVRFTLKIDGDKATMRGTASVDRAAYRIGEDTSTSDIPAKVSVAIAVDATRVK